MKKFNTTQIKHLIKYVLLLFPHVFGVVAKESWCAFYKQLSITEDFKYEYFYIDAIQTDVKG